MTRRSLLPRGLSGVALSIVTLAAAATVTLVVPPGARADDGEDMPGGYEEEDHDAARRAVQRGEALPLSKVIAAVGPELPGEIVEIEFESEHGRWIYEFKVIDATGRLRDVYVDAATARIVPKRDD